MRSTVICVVVTIGVLLAAAERVCVAQATADKSAAEAVKYLPEEVVGTLTLWPARTAALSRFHLAPLEVASAAGLEQVGIDPLKIQRLDMMFALPGPAGQQFGAALQLAAPVQLDTLNAQIFADDGPQDENGFKYRVFAGPPEPEIILHQAGPSTILIGTKIFVKRMTSPRRAATSLTQTLSSTMANQDALGLVSVSSIRPIIAGALDSNSESLPPPVFEDLKTMIKSTDFLAVRLDLDENEKFQLMASAVDDSAVTDVEQSLNNLLAFARDMAVAQSKAAIGPDRSATGEAQRKYIDRVSTEISAMLKPKKLGKRLIVDVKGLENTATIGTLVGLLLPAVQAAREAARRMDSSNNLRQIGLAMFNYEDAYKKFPATAVAEKETNRPLLSWRVTILPFIDQAELYAQFHLDEPWDSPHNQKLIGKMPQIYFHRGRRLHPGHTVYQAPVGEHTLLRKDAPSKISSIIDGTSNTIMLIEASDEAAVVWTRPDDFEINPQNPTAGLFNSRGPRQFQAVMGDGSVRVIAESVGTTVINALFTRDGGEIVDLP